MAKKSVTATAGEIAERLAQKMGYEFVDVELTKEHGAAFLRIFVDKEGGMSLDDCSEFHHAIMKEIEDLDYDYLEISSPGVDRPLKRDRDFERALGQTVEARFYRQMDGVKQLRGKLAAFDAETVTLDAGGAMKALKRADIAQIRMTLDDDEMDSPLFDQLERETEGADNNDHEKDHDGGKSGT